MRRLRWLDRQAGKAYDDEPECVITMVHGLYVRILQVLICGLFVLAPLTLGQKQTTKQKPPEPDIVVRVETELVQTDVTVVDRAGRFVGGLKADDFELRVNNSSLPISFFEQVATGSFAEERQLAGARKPKNPSRTGPENTATPDSDRGRSIFFFVDDVHLAGDSLTRARSVLSHFIEYSMATNDRVAVVSTSGQIGFLQQLTDNKAVLREAIRRLNYKSNPEATASHVTISEVDANIVANRGDRGLFAYLVEATMKEFQMQDPINAVNIVKNRVRQINFNSKLAELNTLGRLESLIRSSAPLPGRKVVFFVSDGFVVDTKRSNGSDLMRGVAQEAARAGVVIYTLDTRSNTFGASVDVSMNDYPDFSSRQAGRSLSESKAPQEPLETLADETGGRSYLNSSTLDEGVRQALVESSSYYLLAWRPDTSIQREGKSRVEVTIKGRPELRVRMRRHFVEFKSAKAVNSAAPERKAMPAPGPEEELRAALGSLYPRRDLPIAVSAGYVNTADKGPVLNVSMQIDSEMLGFEGPDGKHEALVDVLGVALDDRGSFSSFKQKLKVERETLLSTRQRFVQWNQSLPLPAGLYQVRIAVRDSHSARTGSAIQWIEIPAAAANQFSLSSIFIGERKTGEAAVSRNVPVKVDRSFARSSHLIYQVYVYNTAGTGAASDAGLTVKVLRSDETNASLPVTTLATHETTDKAGIPFVGEIDLGSLSPGNYMLEISLTDPVTKSRVTQRTTFVVE